LCPPDGREGYAVIRDALRKTGKVGLAQLTIAGREWLVAVAPLEDGLVMEMLRYADELRDPAEYFDEVPTAKSQKDKVDLATHCNIACPQGPTFPAGTLG
jgi:DNA end-binding protein Ku